MKLLASLWFVAGVVLSTTPAVAPLRTPVVATVTVPPLGLVATSPWWKVFNCEDTGSWFVVRDHNLPEGGLGIRPSTWYAFGGLRFAPSPGWATPMQQIEVAATIEGGYVPDQNGVCTSW